MSTYRPKMDRRLWLVQHGETPIIACALHDGHVVRPEIAEILALTEEEQLREENPYTVMWSTITDTRIVGLRSRFEVDLNRPKETAIYNNPSDAKNIRIWSSPPSKDVLLELIAGHKAFYFDVTQTLKEVERQFGHFIVLDIQSYNHRRDGPDQPRASQLTNPDINIGTVFKNRDYWAPIIDGFISDLRAYDFMGKHLDVRENIKFKSSYFTDWLNNSFPETGCGIVVDVKKFFMDEWTGELFPDVHEAVRQTLVIAKAGMMKRLEKY
ncbi:MAG: N-formylglutamate amidohydrolase [Candidatus Marinimicrobia bacterium]|nr:N-formylglutamate amidohydrolase [Candidatus Neomarinimicrobiota bacterium]MBL7121477.1 N-formylglutamate amidohydrolase [Candidatus Neomarinimicrobiota bacterium]